MKNSLGKIPSLTQYFQSRIAANTDSMNTRQSWPKLRPKPGGTQKLEMTLGKLYSSWVLKVALLCTKDGGVLVRKMEVSMTHPMLACISLTPVTASIFLRKQISTPVPVRL